MTKDELQLDDCLQYYCNVEKEEYKFNTLIDLYENLNFIQILIYCNTSRKVVWLTNHLRNKKYTVSNMNNEMPQNECQEQINKFVIGDTRVMITNDIMANTNYKAFYQMQHLIHKKNIVKQ